MKTLEKDFNTRKRKLRGSLLCKGLNFAIPPENLEYSEFLLPFELLYRDIQNLDVIDQNKQLLKGRIKDSAFHNLIHITKTVQL